jgi:hypothetical protein
MRLHILSILLMACICGRAEEIEIRDRHGIPLVRVADLKAFRYSAYFKKEIPEVGFTAHKLLGDDLTSIRLEIVIHRKDSTKASLFENVVFMFAKKADAIRSFTDPPYTQDTFDHIEINLAEGFKSPEDIRLEKEESAGKEAQEEERQRRLAVERKKRQAQERALAAKEKAESDRRKADEQRKLRATCSTIYRDTADKKIKDLTVREEQLVRTCQTLGLYPPL